jgi:hypothetical protein
MNKIEQIIGRGVRYFSHHALPKEERNVSIFLHINTIPEQKEETIDYRRYRFAIKKQEKINQVENVLKANALDCVLNIQPPINMKNEIVDSKGKKQTIMTEYDNIKCSHKELENRGKYTNYRMLLFDIIEISKQIKQVIQKHSLYSFDLTKMKEFFTNDLMHHSLKHMCKTKMIITINEIKGYLIKTEDMFFFQQKDIDDFKINISDRKQSPRKYISNFVVSDNTDKNQNVNKPSSETINTQLGIMFEDFKKSIIVAFPNKEIQYDILHDMVVDRIPTNLINEIPKIKNEQFLESLKRGNYIIVKDDQAVAFYDMYNKHYKGFSNQNKCNLELNAKYKTFAKKELSSGGIDEDNTLGFIDIVKNKDKTMEEPKSKIKHMDNQKNNKKTFGSACISTSSITIQMLKDTILEYDSTLNLDKKKKETLCLIYEYTLRKVKRYLRTIEHILLKN